MKKSITIITLLSFVFCLAQDKKKLTDEEKFTKYIKENTQFFLFNGENPTGDGWKTLDNLFSANQFVGWGEYHNSALFSNLTTYALETASKNDFKNWCVETSPFVASELMRISKSKNPTDTIVSIYKKGYPKIGSFPFFSTKDDAKMLITANKNKMKIWGIDQEFQMAFPYCIDKVYTSQTLKIREENKAIYDSLKAKWWSPEDVNLDKLKNNISQKKLQNVLDEIKTSTKIYSSPSYTMNTLRATLMKKNFYNYYDNSQSKNEKVFFKMGANHLAKGINLDTRQYDIGNSVFELSQRLKTNYTNVLFIVRYYMEDGKVIDENDSNKPEYSRAFMKLYEKEKWIVVDVRPFRKLLSTYDNSLTIDTYETIEKYDFVVLSPEILE